MELLVQRLAQKNEELLSKYFSKLIRLFPPLRRKLVQWLLLGNGIATLNGIPATHIVILVGFCLVIVAFFRGVDCLLIKVF